MTTMTADLGAAIARAIGGNTSELFRRLELGSGLPGPRVNLKLAVGFSHDCARLGEKADALAYGMATLPPDEAPGASPKEFLSMCGVLAVAAGAALEGPDTARLRDRALVLLEQKADDPRFRVRDAVPIALGMLGAKMGSALAPAVSPWMDRYFHAAAVLRALADPAWLETFRVDEHAAPIALVHDAFLLAHDAPRSAERYPGHKALVEVLASTPRALAKRFGVPMFDELAILAAKVTVPELRAAILANLEDTRMKKPFAAEIQRVRAAIEGGKKPPRDPTRLIQGMRGRGKKRAKS